MGRGRVVMLQTLSWEMGNGGVEEQQEPQQSQYCSRSGPKIENRKCRLEPKIDLCEGSEAGQPRRWWKSCRCCQQLLHKEFFWLIQRRYDNSKRLQPWQQKQESSQCKERCRTNSIGEPGRIWQLRWEWETLRFHLWYWVQKVLAMIGEGKQGTIAMGTGQERLKLARKSACLLLPLY